MPTVRRILRGKIAARLESKVLTSDAIFDERFHKFHHLIVSEVVIGQIEAHNNQEQLSVQSTKTRRTQTAKVEEI